MLNMLNRLLGYDTKVYLVAPVLEIVKYPFIAINPILQVPLWLGVLAPIKVLSMGQIDLLNILIR